MDVLFTLIILKFSLLSHLIELSFIKSRNVFDWYFNYIKNNILSIKLYFNNNKKLRILHPIK